MVKRRVDSFQEALAKKFSRRAALAGLASGGAAATLTLAGAGTTRGANAQTSSEPIPDVFGPAPAGTEILWDTWGVPHIHAESAPGLYYAFGWAQAHNHGNLLLQLYAQARGRGAEVYGEAFLPWDRIVRTMGLHDRGAIWYEEQTAGFRANLDAFAAGINAYAERYPDRLDTAAKAVLPVTAADTLAHVARIFFLFLVSESSEIEALLGGEERGETRPGSNGWAVAPSHTADGHALLLANPHNPWAGEHTYIEAQLSAPGIYDAYGATLVGIPLLAIAFNDHLGWTHTANTLDCGDVYALTQEEDGYRYDDEVLPFASRTETINVLQEDGTLREEELTVRRSVHGPVVEQAGELLAIRMAAIDDWSSATGALEQWWDMGRATNLADFEKALRRLQHPFFTVIYADRDGHILSLFNGQVPVRPAGELDWSGPIPGDTSATLWTGIHAYDDLPRVLDPPGGWVQNSNCPPWYTTYPLVLEPDEYPPYMAPQFLTMRERRGIRMLEENPELTLERLVELKYSTRMELADRVVDELIAAARQSGDATASEAANVLAAWDRQALPTSTGTLLFIEWVWTSGGMEEGGEGNRPTLFSTPSDPADPLTTPRGLNNPEEAVRGLIEAAEHVQSLYGRLDVPWGEVARMQRGDVDLPANGFEGDPFGVFRVLSFESSPGETTQPIVVEGGDAYVAAVEFGETVRAQVLLTYGNASQPGSPHIGDQLELSANGEMRTAWRTREEIEANLEAREELG